MKTKFALILCVIFTVACSVTFDLTSIPPKDVPTQPVYAPTPMIIPLSQIDLETIIIQSGDLPPGYSGSQINELPGYGGVQSSHAITQELAKDSKVVGATFIYLFESVADLNMAYSVLDKNIMQEAKERKNISIGNTGYFYVTDYLYQDFRRDLDIAFVRCNTMVWIRFFGAKPEVQSNDVELYAERLDRRLQPLVCR